MKSLKLLSLSVLLFFTSNTFAQVKRSPVITKAFKNVDCQQNASCDLKEFNLITYDFSVNFEEGDSFGTRSIFTYTTNKVEDLEKYAIIQQTRGCHFESQVDPSGKVIKTTNFVRDLFGKQVRYKHVNWQIDSLDKDPMYSNAEPHRRHGVYKWNRTKNSYDKSSEVLYFNEQPTFPKLYATDIPGTAFFSNHDGIAKNISLEFKVCIYKTHDIPLELTADNINFAEPIACHNWSSSHIYNHTTNQYEVKSDIDPICLEQD